MFKRKDMYTVDNDIKSMTVEETLKYVRVIVNEYNDLREVYNTLARAINAGHYDS